MENNITVSFPLAGITMRFIKSVALSLVEDGFESKSLVLTDSSLVLESIYNGEDRSEIEEIVFREEIKSCNQNEKLIWSIIIPFLNKEKNNSELMEMIFPTIEKTYLESLSYEDENFSEQTKDLIYKWYWGDGFGGKDCGVSLYDFIMEHYDYSIDIEELFVNRLQVKKEVELLEKHYYGNKALQRFVQRLIEENEKNEAPENPSEKEIIPDFL